MFVNVEEPETVSEPVTITLPLTSSLALGEVVPIPTLSEPFMVRVAAELAPKCR